VIVTMGHSVGVIDLPVERATRTGASATRWRERRRGSPSRRHRAPRA
jgi:hypothetical protein